MINRLNFDVLPTVGMYMHNGKVVQVTALNFANETVDCFIVERDGSSTTHNGLTLKELKNIIEPFYYFDFYEYKTQLNKVQAQTK